MLDKHNRYLSDENTGVEMLYRNIDINTTEFQNTDDIAMYNKNAEHFDIKTLQILGEDDLDRINTYIIPQHYKDLDVEEYINGLVKSKSGDSDISVKAKARVEMELAMYKERGLYPILQVLIYVVDTLRKHNLVWGVGRGSSVASYLLHLIGVHKVDSVKYNLDIKEFLKR
jgi:DNA polymerase III alpha subunit